MTLGGRSGYCRQKEKKRHEENAFLVGGVVVAESEGIKSQKLGLVRMRVCMRVYVYI